MLINIFVATTTIPIWLLVVLCFFGIPTMIAFLIIPGVIFAAWLGDKLDDLELKRHNKSRSD